VLKALGSELSQDMDGFEPDSMNAGARESAVSALMVLGYSGVEARAAVARVAPDVTATEEIIKLALKMT
jgi:Holliday junction resolvasome RuvABC DNA-binding subunit